MARTSRKGRKFRGSRHSRAHDRNFDGDIPKGRFDLSSLMLSLEPRDENPTLEPENCEPSIGDLVCISASEERLSDILAAIETIGDQDSEKIFSLACEVMPEVVLPNGKLLAALTVPGITYLNPLPQYPIEINLIRRFNPKTSENFFYETTPRQFEEFSMAVKAYIDATVGNSIQNSNEEVVIPHLPESATLLHLGTENPELKLSQYIIGKETELYLRRQDLSNKICAVEGYYADKKCEAEGVKTGPCKRDRIFYALEKGPALVKEFDQPIYVDDFKPSDRFYERVYKKLTGDASRSIPPTVAVSIDGANYRGRTLTGLGEAIGTRVSTQGQSRERGNVVDTAVADDRDDTIERSLGVIFGMEEARVAEQARRKREDDTAELQPYVSKVPTLAPAFGVAPDANVSFDEYAQRFSTEFTTAATNAPLTPPVATNADDGPQTMQAITAPQGAAIVPVGTETQRDSLAESLAVIAAIEQERLARERAYQISLPAQGKAYDNLNERGNISSKSSLHLPTQKVLTPPVTTQPFIALSTPDMPRDVLPCTPRRTPRLRSALYGALAAIAITSFGISAGVLDVKYSGSLQRPKIAENAKAPIVAQVTAVMQPPTITIDEKVSDTPIPTLPQSIVNSPSANEKPTLDVFFAYNSAGNFVNSEGKALTREEVQHRVEEFVRKTRGHTIYVNGYASIDGKESYNKLLSSKRAKTIALLACEVYTAANVEVRGIGETNKFGTPLSSEEVKKLENLPLAQRIDHVKLREGRRVVVSSEHSDGDYKAGAPMYAGSCKGIQAATSGTQKRNKVLQKNVDVHNDMQEVLPEHGLLEQKIQQILASLTSQDKAFVSSLVSDTNENPEEVSLFLESYLSTIYNVTLSKADIATLVKAYKQPVEKPV